MISITNYIESRKNRLQEIINKEKVSLKTAPEGTLHVSRCRNTVQYYRREAGQPARNVYIPSREIESIRSLAQKSYNQKVLRAAENELKGLQRLENILQKDAPEEIYDKISQERRKLVEPIRLTDEEFVRQWLNRSYDQSAFPKDAPEFYTANGERVRSKSEVIIADLLREMKVPYLYEAPLFLRGALLIHPDFTVLNVRERKEKYFEHFGMMGNISYIENSTERILKYEKSGIFPGDQLIMTFETSKMPLNVKLVRQTIEKYCL